MQKRFPIVSDDEIMLTEMPVMDLYDESDFISNIKGDYQDKNYMEWSPIAVEKKSSSQVGGVVTEAKEKSYAQHGFGIRLFSFFDVREWLSPLKGDYFTTLKNCFAWARVLKLKCHHSVRKGLKPACCITKRKSSQFRCASLVMIRFATKLFSLSTCDASDM